MLAPRCGMNHVCLCLPWGLTEELTSRTGDVIVVNPGLPWNLGFRISPGGIWRVCLGFWGAQLPSNVSGWVPDSWKFWKHLLRPVEKLYSAWTVSPTLPEPFTISEAHVQWTSHPVGVSHPDTNHFTAHAQQIKHFLERWDFLSLQYVAHTPVFLLGKLWSALGAWICFTEIWLRQASTQQKNFPLTIKMCWKRLNWLLPTSFCLL